jgi:hypothetical protein
MNCVWCGDACESWGREPEGAAAAATLNQKDRIWGAYFILRHLSARQRWSPTQKAMFEAHSRESAAKTLGTSTSLSKTLGALTSLSFAVVKTLSYCK